MHVEGMSVNSSLRKHHPNVKPGSGHDLFFKLGPGSFRLWNPETDPGPVYRDQLITGVPEQRPAVEEQDDELISGSREFAFERDLRNYLSKNLSSVERGLTLFEEEGFSGVEFPAGGRFIDILAVDAQGQHVVIELKVSRGYERVMGQLLRYIAWVKHNLANGKKVRGIIVASEITEDLVLAASLVPDVALCRYEPALKLVNVPLPTSS
jgi:hypothetical protein